MDSETRHQFENIGLENNESPINFGSQEMYTNSSPPVDFQVYNKTAKTEIHNNHQII